MLHQLARDYRDPNVPPFHVEALVTAYNVCVPAGLRFPLGRPHCAVEFLMGGGMAGHGGLLGELRLVPNYLVTYLQEGDCPQCGQQYRQVGLVHSLYQQECTEHSWYHQVCALHSPY